MHVSTLDGVSVGEFIMVIILLRPNYIQEAIISLNADKLLFSYINWALSLKWLIQTQSANLPAFRFTLSLS